MSNRLNQLFANGKRNILAVYYTAGFPGLNDTVDVGKALDNAGVDLIEIGIPFSDPVADGPVIQESSSEALKNGMTIPVLLEQLRSLRAVSERPIVLMGYLNPVLQYGFESFCADAAAAGADGLILPDLPLEEFESHYAVHYASHGLQPVFLIAPSSSDERIRYIDSLSGGFVYAVSSAGTTGARDSFDAIQEAYFARLSAMNLRNPVLVGFGVSNQTTFDQACRHTHGAIVGSAFIRTMQHADNWQSAVPNFISSLRMSHS